MSSTYQETRIQEIADAVRRKIDDQGLIDGVDLASAIRSIDRLKPMTNFIDGVENGYYGNQVAKIAATYQLNRVLGNETYVYSNTNLFSDGSPHYVRDSDGKAMIDCSAFVGLCLRGIPYESSPFAEHTGANATWTPGTELPDLYGTDGWEYRVLDYQEAGRYNDLGITGFSTLRVAADLAEFFYKNGYVVYDALTDGTLPQSVTDQLMPGDLLFWAKSTATDAQKERFRSISHVGIVAEKTDKFFEATTGTSVVLYSSFADKCSEIVLICRPDYRPKVTNTQVPIGANLLTYPWTWGATQTSTLNGITFETTGVNSLRISGTNTTAFSRNIKGQKNSDVNYIVLSPGTYQVSGMDGTGIKHVGFAIQVLYADGTDFDPVIRCYDGHDDQFTITETTNVLAWLWFGSNSGNGYTLNCDISPSLVRIS